MTHLLVEDSMGREIHASEVACHQKCKGQGVGFDSCVLWSGLGFVFKGKLRGSFYFVLFVFTVSWF